MRDIERIPRILGEIERMWREHPDERFYQLLINQGMIPDSQLWRIEDEELEEHFKKLIESKKCRSKKKK